MFFQRFNKWLLWAAIMTVSASALAQEKGQLSGNFQMNTRFYERDSTRGAYGTPFYEYLFYGADSWLNLNYRISGFDIGIRFDGFLNSQLINPVRETNAAAIGRWYVTKDIDKLRVSVGYLYDQFGSGLIYRSFENRPLGIDQSLFGASVTYKLNNNWQIKGTTGRLKRQLNPDQTTVELYKPVIKGINLEGYVAVNEKVSLSPGIAALGRTMDSKTMQGLATEINSYVDSSKRFVPNYNTYAFNLYNNLNVGNFSWYIEGALKTKDVLRDVAGTLIQPKHGYVVLQNLGYTRKGLGILLQTRYIKSFDMRTSPNETFNQGLLNFMPPLARQNSSRLLARYAPATQLLGEMAIQADVTYTPKKGLTFNANYSLLENLDRERLYNEIYLDCEIKPLKKKYKMTVGVQSLDYNRFVYQQKEGFVNSLTPFVDFSYKLNKKTAIKSELSYMITKRDVRLFGKEDPHPDQLQDFGDWAWAMVELTVAPHWAFSASDMYTIGKDIHYPTFAAFFTQKASRFGVTYTKQPEGIVCTGGVCRFEPAFSGVKIDVTSSF